MKDADGYKDLPFIATTFLFTYFFLSDFAAGDILMLSEKQNSSVHNLPLRRPRTKKKSAAKDDAKKLIGHKYSGYRLS